MGAPSMVAGFEARIAAERTLGKFAFQIAEELQLDRQAVERWCRRHGYGLKPDELARYHRARRSPEHLLKHSPKSQQAWARYRQIRAMRGRGCSNWEIRQRLGVSAATIHLAIRKLRDS